MMGPKKLSTIREELQQHFSKDGEDAIARLNRLKEEAPEAGELIESLRRFLEGPRKPRGRSKKRRMPKKR